MAAKGISQLIAQIIATIYQNTSNDITGQILQDQLGDIIDSLNQSLYNNLIPYNSGQVVVIDDGGLKKLYLCVTNTTAGESPLTTPAKWVLASGSAGVVLDYIVLGVTELKALTGYSDEDQVLVNANNGLYGFSSISTETPDDDLVVKPDDITLPAPGRWLKLKVLVDSSTTGSIGDLITPVVTNIVAALNDISKSSIEVVNNITALKSIPSVRRDFKVITVRYYDITNESATSGGTKKVLLFKGTDLTNTNWQNLSNWHDLEPAFREAFVTTATNLEGIPFGTAISVGDLITNVLRSLLTPYISSSISDVTLQNDPSETVFEVGASVDIDSITISIEDDSEGDPPLTLYISGNGYNVSASEGINTPPSPLTITKLTDVTEVWTVTGTDANSDPINSDTVQIQWMFRHFVGASNTELTEESTDGEVKTVLDSLQNKILRDGKDAVITATYTYYLDGYYTYIAYAAKYGDLSNIILNSGMSILEAFTEIGDFNYENVEGHIESYRLYRSNATGILESGDIINIE
jgi:hypothetical protein